MKIIILLFLLSPSLSFAWGKRGHFIVGQTASLIMAEYLSDPGLKGLSFDLGYYNNIPDLVWKSDPENYKKEYKEHFMDLEIFRRLALSKKITWHTDRQEFIKQYNPPRNAGRAFWRINELHDKLLGVQKKILALEASKKNDLKLKHKLQGEWVLIAGILGHYVADMAQPLHTTENYDGQLTKQKGLHRYFEATLVNELSPQLDADVARLALKSWKKFHNKHKSLSVFDLIREEANESFKAIPKLLKLDKKKSRKKVRQQSQAYKKLITERLSRASLYLAEIWSRSLTWDFNHQKFYQFKPKPKYIHPVEK